MLQAMILLLILGGTPAAQAADTGRTKWELANFTWVKRVPAEAGAPANGHPIALTEAALTACLGPVKASEDGKDVPLFAKDELASLVKVLSEAFSLAQPGEDLILLSTRKRGGGFMELPLGITARLFVREGALNLLVHNARWDFMGRFTAEHTQPTFTYGSRKTPSAAALQAAGATRLRSDWLALPLLAAAPTVIPPASATLPPALAAVAPNATPEPPPPGVRDAAFYEAQTQRLKALKKLHDENLLSEAEYQEKRDAILKTL
jgi:hypothetical protein